MIFSKNTHRASSEARALLGFVSPLKVENHATRLVQGFWIRHTSL